MSAVRKQRQAEHPRPKLSLFDPSDELDQQYDYWLDRTGSAEAAATMTLATVQAIEWRSGKAEADSVQLSAYTAGRLLDLNAAEPPINANLSAHALADSGLLDVPAAANYLGYNPAGLRKIVNQKRIQYVQNGRGPIKFRREWLDEFITANSRGPQDVVRAPAQKRSKPRLNTEPRLGFDSSLYLR